MRYWLFKSEPDTFSIDDLIHSPKQTAPWDGVRNYQVRNMLRDQIKCNDLAFFYHSSCKEPGIVGTMIIVKEAYPDGSAFDVSSPYYDAKSSPNHPRWFMVDVKFQQKFPRTLSLHKIKLIKELQSMIILRKGNRLSITPVTEHEWKTIQNLPL